MTCSDPDPKAISHSDDPNVFAATSGDEPAITIIVPTYKRPDLLAECLSAIAQQTFEHYVVFVCDNSPEQEARSVVYALQDPRFEYHPRASNIGMLKNVLQGVRDATTKYVMEVDDDDILYPNCLEVLIEPFMRHAGLTIVFGDLDVIDENRRRMDPRERVKYLPSLEPLAEGIHQPFTELAAYGDVFLMASVLRRECIDWSAVPASAATAYDRYLTLAASRGDAAGYFVRSRVMAYRVHQRSDGLRFTAQCLEGALEVLRNERSFVEPSSRRWIEQEIARTRIRLFRAYRADGDYSSGARQVGGLLTVHGFLSVLLLAVRHLLPRRTHKARTDIVGADSDAPRPQTTAEHDPIHGTPPREIA